MVRVQNAKGPDLSDIRLVKVLEGMGGGIGTYPGEDPTVDHHHIVVTDDSVIVADERARRLRVFDYDGAPVKSVPCRSNDYDAPATPSIITLDSRNRIIITDEYRHSIHILDQSCAFIGEFNVPDEADIADIRTTSQDNIIVVLSSGKILMFDSSGNLLDWISTSGKLFFCGNHVLEEKSDDDGWSTHKYTRILYDFTVRNDGSHAFKISKKDMTGRLLYIDELLAVTVDGAGHMHAAGRDCIHVFDQYGEEIRKIQYPTESEKDMDEEEDKFYSFGDGAKIIALDHNLWVISCWSRSDGIWIWDGNDFHHFIGNGISPNLESYDLLAAKKGVVVRERDVSLMVLPNTIRTLFEIPTFAEVPIAADGMGRLIVADHGRVRIMNRDGESSGIIVDAVGQGGRFGTIRAVTTDGRNRIIVRHDGVKGGGERINVFDQRGKFRGSLVRPEVDDDGRETAAGPSSRSVGRNQVSQEEADGRLVATLDNYPMLAHDSHGRAIKANGGKIEITDSQGMKVGEIDASGVDALTVDRWDRIITVDSYRLTIRIFDHRGNLVGLVRGADIGNARFSGGIAMYNESTGTEDSIMSGVSGVAVDDKDRIFVSSWRTGSHMIQIFDSAPKQEDPLRILQARYAKGEITKDEFIEMKDVLA